MNGPGVVRTEHMLAGGRAGSGVPAGNALGRHQRTGKRLRWHIDYLRAAARLVGLPLVDHLIVTTDAVFSLRQDEGWED